MKPESENLESYSSDTEPLIDISRVFENISEQGVFDVSLFESGNAAPPEIVVARALQNESGLFGYIGIWDGKKYKGIGYSLEPKTNIPLKGYIPHGLDKFKKWDSTKLKKTLRLYSVPNFTNVLIHVGNTQEDTRGCILAGYDVDNINKPTRLKTSRKAVDFLYGKFPSGNIAVGWM